MPNETTVAQGESRNERVAIAVTKSEKRAVRALAAFRGTDESSLLRSMTLAQIVEDFERLRSTMPEQGAA